MKTTYLNIIALLLLGLNPNNFFSQVINITAEVCFEASEVRLTGPSFGWNPTAGPLAVSNGDGTWTFEIPAPSSNYEFLLVVDGEQESLIEEMVNGGTCAPITDYFSYYKHYKFYSNKLSSLICESHHRMEVFSILSSHRE